MVEQPYSNTNNIKQMLPHQLFTRLFKFKFGMENCKGMKTTLGREREREREREKFDNYAKHNHLNKVILTTTILKFNNCFFNFFFCFLLNNL